MSSKLRRNGLKKASVSRSFRLDGDLLEMLEVEADKKSLTLNALVSRLLRKYADFGRFAERYGFVSLPGAAMTKIFAAFNEDQVAGLAAGAALDRPREFLAQRGLEANSEGVLGYLCKHLLEDCGYGTWESHLRDDTWSVTLSSPYGIGFTRWAKYYIPAVINEILGVKTKLVSTESTIRFSFPNINSSRKIPGSVRLKREDEHRGQIVRLPAEPLSN